MSNILRDLYKKTNKATVDVLAYFGDNPFVGSGFFINDQGFIFTAAHVVFDINNNKMKADNIYVTYFEDTKSTIYDAVLVGYNFVTDMAILKIKVGGNEYLEWDENINEEGSLVYTIGNPSGKTSLSISNGVIRDNQFHDDNLVSEYILSTVPSLPGNSGGAVINECGKVVSFISFNLFDQFNVEDSVSGGSTQVILNNIIKKILLKGNEFEVILPFLGISVTQLLPNDVFGLSLPKNRILGSLVTSVIPGSQADLAGILPNDVIQKVNGNDVGNLQGQIPISRITFLDKQNDKVNFDIIRGGSDLEQNVTLGLYDSAFDSGFTSFF